MQKNALCRSRRELSNEYFVAKFGFDTAESKLPRESELRGQLYPLATRRGLHLHILPSRRRDLDFIVTNFRVRAIVIKNDNQIMKTTEKVLAHACHQPSWSNVRMARWLSNFLDDHAINYCQKKKMKNLNKIPSKLEDTETAFAISAWTSP